MEFLSSFLIETARVVYEGSFYILIGFVVAGLLHEYLPGGLIAKHLGSDRPRSVVLAALLGAPIPLCSCGVLPAAAALKRKGASRSSLISFLISTPETGVDSIALTYGLLGPLMAVVRPIVAVLTAMVAGLASLLAPVEDTPATADLDEALHDHCADEECSTLELEEPQARPWNERVRSVVDYGFMTLLDEIAFWMAVGILLTGLLAALLPPNFFSSVLGWDRGIVPMLVMIVAGTPLYLCASASTPVAAALIAKGLSPGAALVFLLVGPATNATTITVVGRLVGMRCLRIYLGAIVVVSLAAGMLVDAYGGMAFRATLFNRPPASGYDLMSVLKLASSFVFVALMWTSLRRTGLASGTAEVRDQMRRLAAATSGFSWRSLLRGPVLAGAAALLVVASVPSLSLIVEPGQTGIIERFGRVVASDLPPGLYWHLPAPLGRALAVDADDVRQVDVGFQETRNGGRLVVEPEAFYLTSDENIVDVRSVVQYRVRDGVAYALGVERPDDLVKSLAREQLVRVASGMPIDAIYTSERRNAERSFAAALADEVEQRGLGIEIVNARFLDVHAPATVHDAFRDVASALEDRERDIYVAHGYAAEQRTKAGGEAAQVVETAQAGAATAKGEASGRATAFTKLAAAHSRAPALTEFRLEQESLEASLVEPRKYIVDSHYAKSDIDLWLGGAVPGLRAQSAPPPSTTEKKKNKKRPASEEPENNDTR